jgi:hypothetical protein
LKEFSKRFIEEQCIKYNIASDFTTLIMLQKADQFVDNEIDCPVDHPEYEAWY